LHDDLVWRVFNNPHKSFGLEGRLLVAKEPRIFDVSGMLVAEPDILIFAKDHIIIGEIKLHHSHDVLTHAKRQLHAAASYLRDFPYKYDQIKKFYIPGTAEMKEI
jgi:hypothetical protein